MNWYVYDLDVEKPVWFVTSSTADKQIVDGGDDRFCGAYSTVTICRFRHRHRNNRYHTVHHSTNLASELDDTSFTRSAGLRWGRETIVDICLCQLVY